MDTLAIARLGQPWSEAKAMSAMERRAFLYGTAIMSGGKIDWTTGGVTFPKG